MGTHPEEKVEGEEEALDDGADVVAGRESADAMRLVLRVELLHTELSAIAETRATNITSVHRDVRRRVPEKESEIRRAA